jgi:hypothetical protein
MVYSYPLKECLRYQEFKISPPAFGRVASTLGLCQSSPQETAQDVLRPRNVFVTEALQTIIVGATLIWESRPSRGVSRGEFGILNEAVRPVWKIAGVIGCHDKRPRDRQKAMNRKP